MSVQVSLLGINIDEMPVSEAVESIRSCWRSRAKRRVFFVNAHCFNVAARNEEYRESLGMAEMVLADGSGVMIASKVLRLPAMHNLNGTDLTPLLCAAAAEDGASVFLLGARPGIADRAAERLRERFPGLRIVGTHHGYFAPEDTDDLIAQINAAKPDMLLVALGVPTQEVWLTRRFGELDTPVCLGVGALFDFLSDSVPRAPRWIRRLGIEWLYRLYREPRRLWRRYLVGNMAFLSRVLALRFFGRAAMPAPASVKGMLPNGERAAPLATLAAVADTADTANGTDIEAAKASIVVSLLEIGVHQ